MKIEDLSEVITACNKINEELEEQLYSIVYGMNPWIWLEVQISNEGYIVQFLGEAIYNSENEDRPWKEDGPSMRSGNIVTCDLVSAHYEPTIEIHLRNKINELITNLGKIKL